MARPIRRTSVCEKKFAAALGRGVSVGGAAIEAGPSRSTACEWRAARTNFATRGAAAVYALCDEAVMMRTVNSGPGFTVETEYDLHRY